MRAPGRLTGLGVAVNALALFAALRPADIPILPLGAIIFAYAGLVTYDVFRSRGDPRVLSPALLLGHMTLVFYFVCPGIFLLTGPMGQAPYYFYDDWITYNGSHAKYLLLQFSALLMLFTTVFPTPSVVTFAAPSDRRTRRTVIAAAIMTAMAASAFKFLETRGVSVIATGAGAQIWAAALPIALFGVSVSAIYALEETRRIRIAVLLGTAACIGMLLVSDLARLPVSFLAFLGIAILVIRKYRLRRFLGYSLAIAGLIVALTAAAATYRNFHHHASVATIFANKIASKLLLRQTVSGWCLEEARDRHWEGYIPGSYLNLVSGLVPRVLWPDKPDLSRGTYYAVEYCYANVNARNPHSEALTLLAEPLMEGGREGLFVGEAIILAFLAFATWIMFRSGAAGLVTGVALLPWLTGVEQHLSYYLANCVKMGLFILPFALALHWYVRRAERKRVE